MARRARHGCWGGVAARWKVRYACYTHMIAKFRPYCKLAQTTICCVFQLKISHFRRFEHNILWWQKKIHTSHKKLYKIIAIFQPVFVQFTLKTAHPACSARALRLLHSAQHSAREWHESGARNVLHIRTPAWVPGALARARGSVSRGFSQPGKMLCKTR